MRYFPLCSPISAATVLTFLNSLRMVSPIIFCFFFSSGGISMMTICPMVSKLVLSSCISFEESLPFSASRRFIRSLLVLFGVWLARWRQVFFLCVLVKSRVLLLEIGRVFCGRLVSILVRNRL